MNWQDAFLRSARSIVIYGLKRSGNGFAYDVLRGLQQSIPAPRITPVHLHASSLGGMNCVLSAQQAVPKPDSAVIVLNSVDVPAALDNAASAGVKRAWLVLKAAMPDNLAYAYRRGIDANGGCPLLFIEGLGFPHNFHRSLAKLFKRI